MSAIWRFFVDPDGRWRWEQLTESQVVRRSAGSYDDYDACVADARDAGYAFEASQGGMRRAPTTRSK